MKRESEPVQQFDLYRFTFNMLYPNPLWHNAKFKLHIDPNKIVTPKVILHNDFPRSGPRHRYEALRLILDFKKDSPTAHLLELIAGQHGAYRRHWSNDNVTVRQYHFSHRPQTSKIPATDFIERFFEVVIPKGYGKI